jgi:CxxC motif-containing protein
MQKEIICTVCPRGCHIQVIGDGKTVTSLDGYGCKRGITYAEAEYSAPVRILTTTVKIAGKDNELLPVRSDKPIAKDKILACMDEIKKVSATIPVKRYDILIADILGTGVNIVATKDI